MLSVLRPPQTAANGGFNLTNILAICVGLGLAFQVGHFMEHAVQFGVWIGGTYQWIAATFCGRDMPYMSPPLTAMVRYFGSVAFPNDPPARQMMLGMELLHLMGNGIFLMTIAGVYYFCPSKWVRWAFMIEGGHMCEHIALCPMTGRRKASRVRSFTV